MESGASRTFLVEHYWPGVTAADFAAAAGQVRATAARVEAEGRSIRYLHSTLIPEDESAFCVLEADDAALIAETYERAGVRFERIVEAVETPVHASPRTAREPQRLRTSQGRRATELP